jgi:hypothetical protein
MIEPDKRADWIVGHAGGLRPLPTLVKNHMSDKPTYVRLKRTDVLPDRSRNPGLGWLGVRRG